MKLQITKAELKPDKYGKHIVISMIKLLDDKGKYVKFVKLTDNILDIIQGAIIEVDEDFIIE